MRQSVLIVSSTGKLVIEMPHFPYTRNAKTQSLCKTNSGCRALRISRLAVHSQCPSVTLLESYRACLCVGLVSLCQCQTDVKTDIHIVPVDCEPTEHNLLILPKPDVALVL